MDFDTNVGKDINSFFGNLMRWEKQDLQEFLQDASTAYFFK